VDEPLRAPLERAFAAYLAGRATLGQASAIARLPLVTFLEEARRAGVVACWREG
jgi:predicted HTH domain antitoxin